MLFVECKQGNLFGIRDTDDNTLEYLSALDIKKAVSARLKIYGVSDKGIRVVTFKEVMESIKARYLLLGDEEGFNKFVNESFSMNFKNYKSDRYFYKVADEGFANRGSVNDKLLSVIIPDSVTEIGESAFESCTRLQSIIIPNSVTRIGEDAFSDCTRLQSVVIPDSVTSIGAGAFSQCVSLQSIIIPNSVTEIGESAFYECENLKSVSISSSVTTIELWAFAYCKSLQSVSIPSSVIRVAWDVFAECKSLQSVSIPKHLSECRNKLGCDPSIVKVRG